MKEWLNNIRPPKFLRYLFFIAYSWYRSFKSEQDDAHRTAILFLSMFHMLLLLGLFMNFMSEIANSLGKFKTVLPICFLTGVSFYYLFLYRSKWTHIVKEFEHIKRREQRIGLIYLFMCFVIGFYPILLDMFFGIDLRDR
ncbi:hypothetical protein [uncultured Aquimarina sp.]|uniref:hypothetical protein n=1 Tax=uncultured Aquimarina sp. TaxID=575652 RepID=UPI002618521E|nr:hypothetical protein [uncultured Aquimarina sp.]